VNPKNNFGQTLLDFAANPDNPNDTAEIVDLLRKHAGKTGSGGKAELKAEGK
jgi:ankyrin repeat protein